MNDEKLTALLHDPSPVVRLAAAKIYCEQDNFATILPVVRREIKSSEEWIRLQTAILIDGYQILAELVFPELETALSD